ncbi:HD domain-containing protein [Fusobacterium sp. MFO224]|uniref:HD domain-containing protein n=1 Tax=Fusobacterium sp. MFO224 TaxID=3378070 RepID=UPI003854DFB8
MNQINQKVLKFIKTLINTEEVNELEKYDDQGVKVTAHTYDVLKISMDEVKTQYGTLENSVGKIDLFSIIIGVIIHDLSKGSIRARSEIFSHSQMMLKKPDYIVREAENILKEVENEIGNELKEDVRKQITHIVVSHHGKWGKIYPSTKEAKIVHKADMYSAKYHRINPISANEILELLADGYNMVEVSQKISCTLGVIKDRLKRAKIETKCKNTKHLLNYYKKVKKVPIGDDFFTKRVRETSKLISSVEKKGFKELILKNEALNYLNDGDIFEN